MKLKKEKIAGTSVYALLMGMVTGTLVIKDILHVCSTTYLEDPKALQVLHALALSAVSLCFLYYAILLAGCGIVSLLVNMEESDD
jgi:hypothetical protein